MLVVEAGEELKRREEAEVETMDVEADLANLSLNAIHSPTQNVRSGMRLKRSYKKRRLSMLVDIGSSLNFMDKRTIKGLNCCLGPITPLKVSLDDGPGLVSTHKISRFEWEMQGQKFVTEVYVLKLSGCDLILGVP